MHDLKASIRYSGVKARNISQKYHVVYVWCKVKYDQNLYLAKKGLAYF